MISLYDLLPWCWLYEGTGDARPHTLSNFWVPCMAEKTCNEFLVSTFVCVLCFSTFLEVLASHSHPTLLSRSLVFGYDFSVLITLCTEYLCVVAHY